MLADRALISVQAVSALERGYRKVPYRKTLERLADALGLPDEARAALELSARRARGSRSPDYELPALHNLPRQLTSFVGRDDVVKEIAQLVTMTPLVSLVGTGGVGKTRAAVAVGMDLLERFPDGACFVGLAPLREASLVVTTLAAALRLQESPNRPLLTTILGHLADKQLLVIFDNCEHVIAQVRRTAAALLRDCPASTCCLRAASR